MKKICYSIISIVLVVFVGCTPSKQEQEKQKQQAVQDSIAAVEASKSPILKEFEKAKKKRRNNAFNLFANRMYCR